MTDRGDPQKIELNDVRDENGKPADPTNLTLEIRQPNGARQTLAWPDGDEIVRSQEGFFHTYVDLDKAGDWQFRWEATGAIRLVERYSIFVSPDEFEEFASGDALAWQPTVKEVARYMSARTKDEHGNGFGEFTSETEPTAREVAEKIQEAMGEVTSVLGNLEGDAECLPRLRKGAKGAAILYTCMLIYLSGLPGHRVSGSAPFDDFEKLYERRIGVLKEAVAECLGSDGGESVSGQPAVMPCSSFPCPSGAGRQEW